MRRNTQLNSHISHFLLYLLFLYRFCRPVSSLFHFLFFLIFSFFITNDFLALSSYLLLIRIVISKLCFNSEVKMLYFMIAEPLSSIVLLCVFSDLIHECVYFNNITGKDYEYYYRWHFKGGNIIQHLNLYTGHYIF